MAGRGRSRLSDLKDRVRVGGCGLSGGERICFPGRLVLRKSLILVALAALLLPGQAAAFRETVELMPGVTYTREVRTANGGQIVIHSIVAPRPGGLYDLKPVLSNDLVLGRERLTEMQLRLSGTATVAGVNGDLFTFETGHPTGIFLQNGTLHSRPIGGRSSLAVGLDGLLRIDRVDFFGSWRIGDAPPSPLAQFNRPLDDKEENTVGLFTWFFGGPTPRREDAVDVVLTGFPTAAPNADLTAQIAEVRFGGGTPIPEGGAVLQGRGFWGDKLALEAAPGLPLTVQLLLQPWWDGVAHAIGGGPLIVKDGQPISRALEDFTPSQLQPRHPRTGVGQLADGRILLVAIDGRSEESQGVNTGELAQEMIRLGAFQAMALDAGGSTEIAFDGRVLNTPSDGAERPLGDALMLFYYGAFAPEPPNRVVSPNGDGVAETQSLAYKIVRPSTVDVKLIAPDGSTVWADAGPRDLGVYPVGLDPAQVLQQQGQYQWVVSAVDQDGQTTGMTRTFRVNSTLGFLELSKRFVRPKPERGGKLEVSFQLANPAWVVATVEDRSGKVVRKLRAHREEPGEIALLWDVKSNRKEVVPKGLYTIRIRAANDFGLASLERKIFVNPKPPKETPG